MKFLDLISLEEAKKLLEKSIFRKKESLPLKESGNRALAEKVMSSIDLLPFDKSFVDGYAVRAQDVSEASESNPVQLDCIEEIHVGSNPKGDKLRHLCAHCHVLLLVLNSPGYCTPTFLPPSKE